MLKCLKYSFVFCMAFFSPYKMVQFLCKKSAYHFFITLKIVQSFRVLFSQASETLKLAAPVGQSPASLPSNKKQQDVHKELTSSQKKKDFRIKLSLLSCTISLS